ncbi:hypothetical protein CYFUS_007091 [Cystobacter fuscus]|uniref:Periplasmic heavy metal sensor n=1 Tax=Cystobacter fuscus TaxID=43 RepID=A0A250JCI1_9BACT|nr:periplasmic heavy metal sensor [Cystobacter fuscus]ATB41624.1 hypothetical protein CYFUS_007091 [Cystobacter fuscus]
MFGYIFGAACLAGALFTVRRARRYASWRGGPGPWSPRGRMRHVFERLDTSPGQEKILVQAVEDVIQAAEKLRGLWGDTRSAWAQSLRGEHFDGASLREQDAKQDALVDELRKTIQASLAKVHEALDPRQRRELADLVERGWGFSHHRHRRAHAFRAGHCGWRGAWAG